MKKRIIFFARDLNIGGLEKALVTLLKSLDHDRYEVTLVLESACGSLIDELPGSVRVREYSLSRCGFVPLRKAVNFAKRTLWALKNRGKFAFSCAYCTYSVIGGRLARIASRNSCLYVHSDYTKSLPDSAAAASFFRMLGVENFRRLAFVSNESRENFRAIFPGLSDRTVVINNLVDAAEIRRMAGEPLPFALPAEKTVFIFVGRLEEESKRLTRLLEAFHIARGRRADIALLIVGDGKDMELCRGLTAKYGLESDVMLAGSRLNPYKFMRAADCIVLTSDYEGFPVVYYEAMILGKPIITTVPVSDEYLDMADRARVVEKTPLAIAEALCGFEAGTPGQPPDTEELNRLRLRALENLINEG